MGKKEKEVEKKETEATKYIYLGQGTKEGILLKTNAVITKEVYRKITEEKIKKECIPLSEYVEKKVELKKQEKLIYVTKKEAK